MTITHTTARERMERAKEASRSVGLLGDAAKTAALRAIADANLEKAVLDVDTDSPTGANTLYEGLGFAFTERDVALVRRL